MKVKLSIAFSVAREPKAEEPVFEHRDTHADTERDGAPRIGFTIPSSAEPLYPDEEERVRLGAEFDRMVKG